MRNLRYFNESKKEIINKEIISDIMTEIVDKYKASFSYPLTPNTTCLKLNLNEEIDEVFFKQVIARLVKYYYEETGTELFVVMNPINYEKTFLKDVKFKGMRQLNLYFYTSYSINFRHNVYFSLKSTNQDHQLRENINKFRDDVTMHIPKIKFIGLNEHDIIEISEINPLYKESIPGTNFSFGEARNFVVILEGDDVVAVIREYESVNPFVFGDVIIVPGHDAITCYNFKTKESKRGYIR